MQHQEGLRTILKLTRTSAGSKCSTYNFAIYKKFILGLNKYSKEVIVLLVNFTVAKTLHNLSEK